MTGINGTVGESAPLIESSDLEKTLIVLASGRGTTFGGKEYGLDLRDNQGPFDNLSTWYKDHSSMRGFVSTVRNVGYYLITQHQSKMSQHPDYTYDALGELLYFFTSVSGPQDLRLFSLIPYLKDAIKNGTYRGTHPDGRSPHVDLHFLMIQAYIGLCPDPEFMEALFHTEKGVVAALIFPDILYVDRERASSLLPNLQQMRRDGEITKEVYERSLNLFNRMSQQR